MTLEDLKTVLLTTGYEVAYESFPEEEAPSMPFLCYSEAGTNNFGADGTVYHPISMVQVQLFTKNRDLTAEGKVEEAFKEARIFWEKTPEADEEQRYFRVIYELEI